MDSRLLKILAVVLMTVDHVGLLVFPHVEILRIIGRLAYPLFAFLVAYGCIKTRNLSGYFLRLIAFAVWLEIAWVVLPVGEVRNHNIFFTLAFGVLAVWTVNALWKNAPAKEGFVDRMFLLAISVLLAGFVALTAGLLQVDFGVAGVALIAMFYASLKAQGCVKNRRMIWLSLHFIGPVMALAVFNGLLHGFFDWPVQWWSMLAAVILWTFVDKRLRVNWAEKYFFYVYYPLHFLILLWISPSA